MSNKNEMRCFCSRHPLLAVYGIDEDGELYLHIKVYKQTRVYAEIFVSANAKVKIRCRECLRFHTVKIVSGNPQLKEIKDSTKLVNDNESSARVASVTGNRVR